MFSETNVLDETLKSFPNDIDFDTDLKKKADISDSYDELVAALPKFDVFKRGEYVGVSKVQVFTSFKILQ